MKKLIAVILIALNISACGLNKRFGSNTADEMPAVSAPAEIGADSALIEQIAALERDIQSYEAKYFLAQSEAKQNAVRSTRWKIGAIASVIFAAAAAVTGYFIVRGKDDEISNKNKQLMQAVGVENGLRYEIDTLQEENRAKNFKLNCSFSKADVEEEVKKALPPKNLQIQSLQLEVENLKGQLKKLGTPV